MTSKVHRHFTALILALTLTLQWGILPNALAQHIAPAVHNASPALQTEKKVTSGLEAYDTMPLGDRMPLVLVHGIGGTESKLFHWENFLTYTQGQPSFNQRYKIYLYHYDSTRSVPAISRDLQKTLKTFVSGLGNRNIKILAYSEGGLLTRNALQDKYLDEHTDAVLTIATPFHGSPLANPEWLGAQMKTESRLNLIRMATGLAYKITGRLYPTFRQDFHWDNFDNAIPKDQYEKSNGPATTIDYSLARKKNFITYGSYFGLDVDSTTMTSELGLQKAPPPEKPMFSNLFKKNFLFSMIRNNIGKLPLAHKPETTAEVRLHTQANLESAGISDEAVAMAEVKLEDSGLTNLVPAMNIADVAAAHAAPALLEKRSVLKDNPELARPALNTPASMMMYNDGISPISSTLWLGRYTPNFAGISQPVDRVWAALKSLKGSRNARLFAGLDHRNWMDGTTRTGNEQVQDLLNPDESPRSVFQWILYDLMG